MLLHRMTLRPSRIAALALTGSLLLLSACSDDEALGRADPTTAPPPQGVTMSVEDLPDKLSSNPGDKLFRFRVAGAGGYAVADLGVIVRFGVGTPYTMRQLVLADENENGKLDPGESVTVLEGSANAFSEAYLGQDADIELGRYGPGDPVGGTRIATGRWRAQN